MKPKEIIYKSGIVNGVNARNQDEFLDLMITELKNTYVAFAKDDSERHFTASVKEIRDKWDAISNKIPYGLPEGLWRYFYIRIMNYKKRACPTWAKVQEEEHEKYLERQKKEDIKHIEQKILDLSLKAKWYLMQESGEKTEEYREITPYWCNRLLGECPFGIKVYWESVLKRTFEAIKENGERIPQSYNLHHLLIWQYGVRGYTHVRFRYGYTKRTFTHKIDSITIGYGKPEWGAPTDKEVFIIKHHKEE